MLLYCLSTLEQGIDAALENAVSARTLVGLPYAAMGEQMCNKQPLSNAFFISLWNSFSPPLFN